ncbi:MAG: glutathione S-transferase family protein [Rhodospirillales bacterium]
MMELYTHPFSPASQKVRLVLAEKALAWERQDVDLPNKENLEPWYRELNSLGMLPTLVDNGVAINESSVICEYLEDAYPDPPLRPDTHAQRAKMRWWMCVVDDRLHYSAGAMVWPASMRPALLQKSEEEREAILSRIPDRARQARHRRWVEHGVDNPDFNRAVLVYQDTVRDMDHCLNDTAWLAGEQFTLGDCALLPYFQAMDQMGWDGMYSSYPNVADWFERGRARPSYQDQITAQIPSAALDQFKAVGAQFNDLLLETIATAA